DRSLEAAGVEPSDAPSLSLADLSVVYAGEARGRSESHANENSSGRGAVCARPGPAQPNNLGLREGCIRKRLLVEQNRSEGLDRIASAGWENRAHQHGSDRFRHERNKYQRGQAGTFEDSTSERLDRCARDRRRGDAGAQDKRFSLVA